MYFRAGIMAGIAAFGLGVSVQLMAADEGIGGAGGTSPAKPVPPSSLTDYFRQLDKNGDGQLSLEEFTRGNKTDSIFVSWDTNNDHFLSLDEFVTGAQKRTGTTPPKSPQPPTSATDYFRQLDKNGDGKLSLGEFTRGNKTDSIFVNWDTNQDHFLSLDEFLDGIKKGTGGTAGTTSPASPPGSGSWGPTTGGTGSVGSGTGTGKTGKSGNGKKTTKTSPEEYFQKLDVNGDGKVSLDEFTGKKAQSSTTEALFVAWDKDGDHFLSLTEFAAGLKKRK